MTGARRLSQAISEGDGISIIALVGALDDARAAEEQGAEGLAVRAPVEGIREKELFAPANLKALGIPLASVKRRVAALGKGLGPPWSQDEKFAALAAWLTLAR